MTSREEARDASIQGKAKRTCAHSEGGAISTSSSTSDSDADLSPLDPPRLPSLGAPVTPRALRPHGDGDTVRQASDTRGRTVRDHAIDHSRDDGDCSSRDRAARSGVSGFDGRGCPIECNPVDGPPKL